MEKIVEHQDSKKEQLTIESIRAAIARMLVLARHCEQHLTRTAPSLEAAKEMKRMVKIAAALNPVSNKETKWLKAMQIGQSIDEVYRLYKKYCEKKNTKADLKTAIAMHWKIQCMPLDAHDLTILTSITAAGITACGGPKEAAMIKVGQVFGYCNGIVGNEEVPTQIREIYKKYKRDRHKLAGTVVGHEAGFSHHSFADEVTRGSLLCYYLGALVGLPIEDSIRISNHIGELVRKNRTMKIDVGHTR